MTRTTVALRPNAVCFPTREGNQTQLLVIASKGRRRASAPGLQPREARRMGAPRQGWTEPEIALAKKLFDDGLSPAWISTEFRGRRSRNSVIGLIHRQGWHKNGPQPVEPPRPPLPKRASELKSQDCNIHTRIKLVAEKNAAAKQLSAHREDGIEADGIIDTSTELQPLITSILDLTFGKCRWPSGEPVVYCGRQVWANQSYCGAHCLRAFQRSKR